jgi:hypothetical protein
MSLSHCALGDHTAGPLELFNILNCIPTLSVMRPICPPIASISLTICPLAMPPTAGLQGMRAIESAFIVMIKVLRPFLAAANAASQPACPAPTTITSYLFMKKPLFYIWILEIAFGHTIFLLGEMQFENYKDVFMSTDILSMPEIEKQIRKSTTVFIKSSKQRMNFCVSFS